jgi:hypothetical protein
MTTLKIDQMPLSDKLAVMEQLWVSISQKPEKVASPRWHREVLAARRKKMSEGKAKFITLSELHRQLSR